MDERLRAFAEGVADAHARTGPMFAVAREAEASEPVIAAAFDAARRDTLASSHRMWRDLADDGLLHPDVDVEWVANTTGLLASADTTCSRARRSGGPATRSRPGYTAPGPTSRPPRAINPHVSDEGRFVSDRLVHDHLPASANAELYGGWPMIISGLKTPIETGERLTTPGSPMSTQDEAWVHHP